MAVLLADAEPGKDPVEHIVDIDPTSNPRQSLARAAKIVGPQNQIVSIGSPANGQRRIGKGLAVACVTQQCWFTRPDSAFRPILQSVTQRRQPFAGNRRYHEAHRGRARIKVGFVGNNPA